tara:strand:+ start:10281 stop:11441 length:1161 start_codon:yes stop_codon:yes gene_type:complete
MRILIVVGIFPPDIGGPATFVPLIAKKLLEKGYSIDVICLSDTLDHDDLIFDFKVHRIKRRQNLIFRWIQTVYKIIKIGKESDLLFVNGLPMESYIANLIIRKKSLRKVVGDWAWERGRNLNLTTDAFDEFQNNRHNIHLEIAKFSRGWTAKKVDLVITPSNHLKSVVENWGVKEHKIKVIYNGTKISPLSSELLNFNDINLITVGRLAPFKNIDRIIMALNQITFEDRKIKLFIVGDGPERQNLEMLVKKLKLESKVLFTGQLLEKELNQYYKKSNIYIQASGYEGLPHTLLEAISHNLSIVSTPIGGTNEILENNTNGWTVDLIEGKYPSEQQIAIKVLNILNNKKEDEAKKINARKLLINNFDKDKNFEKYIETIRDFTNNER